MTDIARIPEDLLDYWFTIKDRGTERMVRADRVAMARAGNLDAIMPGVFPDNWPRPVVANIIDTSARDVAEMLARMPSIECQSSNNTSERSKIRSSLRTKIALYYVEHSRLKLQLYTGCDWYNTFAAMPIVIEPDFEDQCPRMRVDDPRGSYWETDFYGNVKVYAHCWTDEIGSLCAKFPHLADIIKQQPTSTDVFQKDPVNLRSKLDVVQMYYKDQIILFLPERQGLVLSQTTHRLGKVPVVVAERPKWDEHNRGQFDDVMWVWLARARMAVYGLEAADKAVRAPIAVPDDVTQISFGADAIIRTNEPDKVRRVAIELPNSSLIETQALDKEIADGARIPQARRGDVEASVITGRGVEALTATFSTQLATSQDVVGDALRKAISMCFEMDEVYWPNASKTVTGVANGTPFSQTYRPARDIAGDYTVSVTYGMTAGMDPNRAAVFLLQLRGDQLIDRDTFQRQLPFDVDVEQMQRKIDIEQIEDALKQGLYSLLANAPAMSMQGIDPLQTLQRTAQIVSARENGTPIHEAVLAAFEPTPAQQAQSPADQLMQQLSGGQGGGLAPALPGGGNAELGAGGAPDIQTLLAGLRYNGQPNLQANVSRRLPA